MIREGKWMIGSESGSVHSVGQFQEQKSGAVYSRWLVCVIKYRIDKARMVLLPLLPLPASFARINI